MQEVYLDQWIRLDMFKYFAPRQNLAEVRTDKIWVRLGDVRYIIRYTDVPDDKCVYYEIKVDGEKFKITEDSGDALREGLFEALRREEG